jgi:hypothetical protein
MTHISNTQAPRSYAEEDEHDRPALDGRVHPFGYLHRACYGGVKRIHSRR